MRRQFEILESRKLLTILVDLDSDGDLDGLNGGSWFENVDARGTFIGHLFSPETEIISKPYDLDADGDLDIVTTENRWYENENGDFSTLHELPSVIEGSFSDVTIQDVGLDGDPDIVMHWQNEDSRSAVLYVNTNGKGSFTQSDRVVYTTGSREVVDIGDFEADGDLDIIVFERSTGSLLRQTNSGIIEEQIYTGSFYRDLDLLDVDGDGLLDLFISEYDFESWPESIWLRNNESSLPPFEIHEIDSQNVRLLDLDGDGDLDRYVDKVLTDSWSFNDGQGNFTDEIISDSNWFKRHTITGVADLNGDGIDDFMTDSIDGGSPIWHDRNATLLAEPWKYATELISIMQADLRTREEFPNLTLDLSGNGVLDDADWDLLIRTTLRTSYGDANLDRVFASSDLIQVFQHGQYDDGIPNNSTWADGDWNGDGDFDSRDIVLAFARGSYDPVEIGFEMGAIIGDVDHMLEGTMNMLPIDLDGDGDLDVIANEIPWDFQGNSVWYENVDGQGNFGDASELVSSQITNVGDADGDGDVDLFGHREWIENIGGNFVAKDLMSSFRSFVADVGDIDGDGDLDIQGGGISVWWENTGGQGRFVFHDREQPGYPGGSILADIDNDRDLDLVRTLSLDTIESQIVWFENDGAGDMSIRHPVESVYYRGLPVLEAADVDGDGDLDFIALLGSASRMGKLLAVSEGIVWYENVDGQGTFDIQRNQISLEYTLSDYIVVADFDNDGDVDLAFGSNWYENTDGKGTFSPAKSLGHNLETVHAGDIDGDGDVDLLVVTEDERLAWLENHPI